jgi:asparagine synthase (glutamine-hydrolysing)
MCGIAGLVMTPPAVVRGEQIKAFSRRLAHRGPDDFGWLHSRNGSIRLERDVTDDVLADVILIHRRLSILDLTATGWQPMGTPDGRYFIVFNGEIYNYLELRHELEALGHEFRSHSDTEVLLSAYAEWGHEALNRFVGMFAFAILDLQTRKVFLARDFFGIKPLYYAYWQSGFAFASEIQPLLDLPGINRQVNPQRTYDFLRFGITDHGMETMFADIKQLPAAHFMEVSLERPKLSKPVRYWSIDLNQKAELSFDQAAVRLRDLFLESLQLHLRSDVPIGSALSGGIDSSAIVSGIRYLNPQLEIHSFSYVPDQAALSEEKWIDIVGKSANAIIHKVNPRTEDLLADFDHLVALQGESFGGTSIYAQSRVFRLAHENGIKVMLDGQGADELLGGYVYFIAARLGSLFRQGHWYKAIELIRSASRLPGMSALWVFLRSMDYLLPSSLQVLLRSLIHKELTPPWMNAAWFKKNGVDRRSPGYKAGREVLRESLQTDLETGLPHLLRFEDRNSMAFSIESRVPFLTPALANFIFSLPEEYIVTQKSVTKAVFRKAMRGIVPDAILDRKDKIGFATPEKDWLLGLRPQLDTILKSEVAMQLPLFNMHEIHRRWDEVALGHRDFDWSIWRWLIFILWVQKFNVRIEPQALAA